MAKRDQIYIDVIVDGKMQKVAVEASQLGNKLDNVGKSAHTADRNLKGLSQQSANGTKNFSKMSQGMGGLVGVYATLAAQAFAVSAAFEFLKKVGDLRVLRDSQVAYASTTGIALRTLSTDIRAAADGLLTFQEASSAAAIGVASGLSAGQLTDLAEGASAVSKVLGRDVSDSFDRLVRGVTKAEPELLDELGITLRLEDAKRKYAAANGKTVKSLSLLEQKQAVLNEVQGQLETKFISTTEAIDIQESAIKKVGVAFSDVFNSFATAIAGPVEKAASFFAENIKSFIALIGLFAYSIAKDMLPSLDGFIEKAEMSAQKASAAVAAAQADVAGLQAATTPSQVVSGALQGVKTKPGSGIDRLRNQEQLTKRQAATLLRYANLEKGVYKDLTMYQRQVYKKALRDILGQKETFWQRSKRGWYSLGNTIELQAKRARATWTKAMAGIKKVSVATLDFINKYATKAIVIIAVGQMLLDAATAAGKFLGVIEDAPAPLQDLSNNIDTNKDKLQSLSQEFAKLEGAVSKHLEAVAEKSGEEIKPTITSLKTITNAFKTSLPALIEYVNLRRAAQEVGNKQLPGFEDGAIQLGVEFNTEEATTEAKKLAQILSSTFDMPGLGVSTQMLTHFIGKLKNGFLPNVLQSMDFINGLALEFEKLNQIVQTFDESFNSTNQQFDAFLTNITKYKTSATDLLEVTKKEIDLLGTQTENLGSLNDMEIAGLDEIKTSLIERLAVLNLINEAETAHQMARQHAQVKYNAATRFGTTLLNKRAQAQKAIDDSQAEINRRVAELAGIESGRIQVSEERKTLLEGELAIMLMQLETMKEMEEVGARAGQAALEGLESNLSDQIAAVIKGEESSLKDALANVFSGMAKSVADEMANVATENIMKKVRGIFGLDKEEEDPAQLMKNAMIEAGDLTAAKWKTAITEAGIELEKRIAVAGQDPVSTERTTVGGEIISSEVPGSTVAENARAFVEPLRVKVINPLDLNDRRREEQTSLLETDSTSESMKAITNLGKLYTDPLPVVIMEKGTGFFLGGTSIPAPKLDNTTVRGNTGKIGENTKITGENTDVIDKALGSGGTFETGLNKIMGEHGDKVLNATHMLTSLMSGGASTASMVIGAVIQGFAAGATAGGGTGGSTGGGTAGGGFRYGGIAKDYSIGGIARGPQAGYPATLHGTEAVVPLPNNKSIPVDLQGAGSQNNVVVNVSVNNEGGASEDTQADTNEGKKFGSAISAAVQTEIIKQQRNGGLLSPYG